MSRLCESFHCTPAQVHKEWQEMLRIREYRALEASNPTDVETCTEGQVQLWREVLKSNG